MKLEGRFTVAAPREQVWEAIRDPGVMAPCVPGCEAVERIDDASYRAVISVKFGPITARFNLIVAIEEEVPPRMVRVHSSGEEGTRASRVSARSVMTLEAPDPEHTEVAWEADVTLTGRLAKYGIGLMRKKVESLSAEFVTAFGARLEAEASSP